MAWYRKTTPSAYVNLAASNFTDTTKNWRKYANMYRLTSGTETASLTAVPGRYTDDTRTWRRIKSIYRWTGSSWVKIFGKFAGQPYAEVDPVLRYNSYTGPDIVDYAYMGLGTESIQQNTPSNTATFIWGRDGQDWQNVENATRSATFVRSLNPLPGGALAITNDEGNYDGDKLRNIQSVIEEHDGYYIWYRDRYTTTGGSSGTAYSQMIRLIKQAPIINSLNFKTNDVVSAGSAKYIQYSIDNVWYRSADQSRSYLRWYILDGEYDSPTPTKLYGTTSISSTSPLSLIHI